MSRGDAATSLESQSFVIALGTCVTLNTDSGKQKSDQYL